MKFSHMKYKCSLDMNFTCESCEIHVAAELPMKADQQFTLLKKSPLLVSQIQSSKERLHQYFDII